MEKYNTNSTINTVISDPDYGEFMSHAPKNGYANWSFPGDTTVGKVWNTIALWRPKFCGKKHEMPHKNINPIICEDRENPCCGHPEITWMYHGLGVGGYLAQELDTTIPHPAEVLLALVGSDNFSFSVYRPGWIWVRPSQEQIQIVQESERKIYETITLPYMQRVSEVLRKMT